MREFVKLSDICKIFGGYTPKPSELFSNGSVPYFKVSDMNRDGNEREMQETDLYMVNARKTFPKGSVVFPKNGGAVATNKKRILAQDSVVDLNTGVAVPSDKVNKDYFFYFFLQIDFKQFIKEGTLPVLRLSEISDLMLFLPSLDEQRRIVDVLDAELAKIDALKANAEKNLQNAKDLFKAALNQEFEPKKDWNRISLAEVCTITSKLVDPQLDEYRSLVHIGGANIESETGKLINLKTAEEEKLTSGKFVFNNATVLYNKIRPYLKKVARPDFNGLCSADMYPLTPSKGMSRDFLYYLLLTDDFTKYAIQGSARAGMPKVNRECLFAYECYVPSGAVQTEIAMRLDDLKDRCKTLQENYEKTITLCDDLKQALLRKAFNGDI